MPRVEREEFLNAGVVLYCASKKFLQVLYKVDEQRIAAFAPMLDMAEVCEYLDAFQRICTAVHGSGAIGKLPMAERFRWLTATRSTVVQSSKVHPGFTDDPQATLEKLFEDLVL